MMVSTACSKMQHRIRWNPVFVALLALTLVVRIVVALVYQPDTSYEAMNVDAWYHTAVQLAQGQGYSRQGVPTGMRGPTVVLFFASIVRLFGVNGQAIIAAQWLCDLGTATLLYAIACQVFRDRLVGYMAMGLFAFYGPGIFHTMQAWSEPLFTLILAATMLWLLRTLERPSLARVAGLGVLIGISTLARPAMLYYPLALVPIFFLGLPRQSWHQLAKGWLVIVLALLLTIAPWTIRNYAIFGDFIPASTHFGRTLYQAHLSLRTPSIFRYVGAREARQTLRREVLEPLYGPAPEVEGYWTYLSAKGLNEWEAEKLALREARALILLYPLQYLALSAWRLSRLWFNLGYGAPPSLESVLVAVTHAGVLALAALALLRWRGPWVRRALPLLITIVYFTILYSATQALVRYIVPVVPYMLLLAGYSLANWLDVGSPESSPRQWIA